MYFFSSADLNADVMVTTLLFIFPTEAAGKMAREEGKQDGGSVHDDSFADNLSAPTNELVANLHCSR